MSVPLTRANAAGYVAMENRTSTLQIGRESQNWRHFDGGLDELRLWNVARTAGELQSTMTIELTGAELGSVGYWKFNEGTGITVDDASAGTLGATLSSAAMWRDGGPLVPAAPDTTPPGILNVTTSGLTDRSVTVSFGTSEAATARVSSRRTPRAPARTCRAPPRARRTR